MTEKLVAVRTWFDKTVEGRRDAGQGTLEYVGMIIVASLIVIVVVAALNPGNIGPRLEQAVKEFLPG